MLRSLFSGVSGLQSHQIALDVESNNIANVNTVGYKYSRANFSDLLSQTSKIATAPQGDLGGKNALQVGLGSNVDSVTRIFSQGSLQNSDKNTDVAIQGDGFYVVSADGGSTYKYTRSGDFKFDADGNFVDNNGFKVQGWDRDEITGNVDSSAPIKSIQIPPGLTTPAEATADVVVKANLNSGSTVTSFGAIFGLDEFTNAADLNRDNVLNDKDSLTGSTFYGNTPWSYGTVPTGDELVDKIDESVQPLAHIFTDPTAGTIVERGEKFSALVDTEGRSFNLQTGSTPDAGQGQWMSFQSAKIDGQVISANNTGATVVQQLSLFNSDGTEYTVSASIPDGSTSQQSANIIKQEIDKHKDNTDWTTSVAVDPAGSGDYIIKVLNDNSSTMKNIQIKDTTGGVFAAAGSTVTDNTAKKFRYTDNSVNEAGWNNPTTINTSASFTLGAGGAQAQAIDVTNFLANDVTVNGVTLTTSNANGQFASLAEYAAAINEAYYGATAVAAGSSIATVNGANIDIESSVSDLIFTTSDADAGFDTTGISDTLTFSQTADTFYFSTTEELREGMQELARNYRTLDLTADNRPGTGQTGLALNNNATVTVSTDGKFTLENKGGDGLNSSINITTSSIEDTRTTQNVYFSEMISSMTGALPVGSTSSRQTQPVGVPTHSSSIDIYDSLGSKHTLKLDFRKEDSGTSTGATWYVRATVPSPAVINAAAEGVVGQQTNSVEGRIYFNDDGSLKNIDAAVRNIQFTGNNGSAPDQAFTIDYGTLNKFDGMTSFDNPSSTSGISQDGFPGGDLVGIRIDQSGTLVGSFTNGRSFGLAQISMAKFANNEGLVSDGGNTFLQSSNSGNPITGTAATGGRGFIQASALEASNVDLSRSLTQLIIIQKGYQANGKTITTSDQILETLIGLKR
ncbi:MAG: flagellar hook-basal body complex protein [Campylobacterota bacterium]|nr:flagellar hook-basal body complex protein [Campylobacterota bacterium]